MRLATNKDRARKVKRVVLFGGFADWRSVCNPVLLGENVEDSNIEFDIRVVPVIFLHILNSSLHFLSTKDKNMIRERVRLYIDKIWHNDFYSSKNNFFS